MAKQRFYLMHCMYPTPLPLLFPALFFLRSVCPSMSAYPRLPSDPNVLGVIKVAKQNLGAHLLSLNSPLPMFLVKKRPRKLTEIRKLLSEGVIQQAGSTKDVYMSNMSNIFMKDKQGCTWTVVLDLTNLNQHSKIESL